jgi:nucleoside 2-deoxyribosyltransferase
MIWYLAGPIDFDKDRDIQSWKQKLKELCKNSGRCNNILLFDPDTYSFNKITSDISTYIHDVNMAAIDHADGLIVRWMSGQISVGTPIELYYAIQQHKKIILVTDMVNSSVYINFIANHSTVVVKDVDKAYGEMLRWE